METHEYQDIYRLTCERQGKNLNRIINSMPIYGTEAGDVRMTSLQNLAPFSAEAAELLDRYNVRVQIETLESVALSVEREEYVPSGLTRPPAWPARNRAYVTGWTLGLPLVLTVGVPLVIRLWPCNPFGRDCGVTFAERLTDLLPVTGGLSAVLLASAFVPGLLAIWRDRQRKARRAGRGAGD